MVIELPQSGHRMGASPADSMQVAVQTQAPWGDIQIDSTQQEGPVGDRLAGPPRTGLKFRN
jgi:hypothetical protein